MGAQLAGAAAAPTAREWEMDLAAGGKVAKRSGEHASAEAAPDFLRQLASSGLPGSSLAGLPEEIDADAGSVHGVEMLTAGGRECEVSATTAGLFRCAECELPGRDLPPAVQQALERVVPGDLVRWTARPGRAGLPRFSATSHPA